MNEETIEKVFQVPIPARLSLGNIRGSVVVQPGKDGEIAVSANKLPNSGSMDRTEIHMYQGEDGSVHVETRYDDYFSLFFFENRPCKIDYVVRVPRQCSLRISGVSSSLRITGELEGSFSLHSVSGGMDLSGLSGDIRIHTVSGSIEGQGLRGELDYDTVSGCVRMPACSFGQIKGHSVSGTGEIETPLSQGPYRFNTVSGSIRLAVPSDTRCTASIHTISGNLSSSLPGSSTRLQRHDRVMQIQGGGVEIFLNSISGGLSIQGQGGGSEAYASEKYASDETPSDQAAAAPPLSTMEILQRVERGELSVEEALQKL